MSSAGNRLDEPGRWRDCHQSGRRPRDRSQHAGLAGLHPFRPNQPRVAARIKSEPAGPQQARADETENQTVRLHPVSRIPGPLTQVQRANQRGNSRSNVHHRAAREIEAQDLPAQIRVQQASLTPDHVGHGEVDDQSPQRHEQRGDDREHQLVHHESLLRNGTRIIRIRCASHAVQKQIAQIADEQRPLAEGQAISRNRPNYGDHCHHDETLHHGGEHILFPDQPAVKKSEARPGHHQDQGGAGEHPGVIAGALRGLGRRIESGYLSVNRSGRRGCRLSKGGRGQQQNREQTGQIPVIMSTLWSGTNKKYLIGPIGITYGPGVCRSWGEAA
jgi:hypothetical protein